MDLAYRGLDGNPSGDLEPLQRSVAARWVEAGLVLDVEDVRREVEESAGAFLRHLVDAVGQGKPAILLDWVAWAKAFVARRGGGPELLRARLRAAAPVVDQVWPRGDGGSPADLLERISQELDDLPEEHRDGGQAENPLGDLHLRYLAALMAADRRAARELVVEALDAGTDVRDLYLHVFQASQREMGRRWQLNQVSVAQEHFCTAATQLIMSQLYDRIFATDRIGRLVVVTSVAGDLHQIGARMVADFFEMEGWDTVYLGADVPHEDVLDALERHGADGLAVSATMTPHVRAVAELVARVRASSAGESRWILVGGWPFSLDPGLWQEIGADAMARDAADAVVVAERLSGAR